MKPAQFFIPSYHRADKQLTVEYLHKAGYPKEQIHIFTQCEDDYHAYQVWSDKAIIHYAEGYSHGDNFHNILQYIADNHLTRDYIVVELDDDLHSVLYYKIVEPYTGYWAKFGNKFKEQTIISKDEIDRLLNNCRTILDSDTSYAAMTISSHSCVNANNYVSLGAKFTSPFVVMSNNVDLVDYHESLVCCSDILLGANLRAAGYKILYPNNVTIDVESASNPGGCQENRTNDVQEANLREIYRRYPNQFCLSEPKTRASKSYGSIHLLSRIREKTLKWNVITMTRE